MNRISQNVNVASAGIALALGAIVGYQALAQRGAGPTTLVIAAVRMEQLLDGLQQWTETKAEIDRLETAIAQEGLRRYEAINQLEEKYEDTLASTREEELIDQLVLERIKVQYWNQQATADLKMQTALRLQDLYASIKEATEALAQAAGYDMVIINDAVDELPFDRAASIPAQVQMLQQIGARKILCLNPAIDITDDLITRMNNAFRASQGGP